MLDPAGQISAARVAELARTLVTIPSVTNHEQQIADWVYERLRAMGLAGVQRLPVEESGDTVVGWIDGPDEMPALMFNFHLDTFPVCEGWATDPFTPHLEDGRLYGLGAHDMKGGAACILAAV